MSQLPSAEAIFDAVAAESPTHRGPSASYARWENYLHFLFDGVEWEGKRVLDIGGGMGTYSFLAASRGAREVLVLEPEEEGHSQDDTQGRFERIRGRLGLSQVMFRPETLQEWKSEDGTFDVVISHASVNHLDEDACESLGSDPAANASYVEIFRKLASICSPGAKLVLADCDRHNFFASIGMKSPFAPTIEWEKHQSPYVWAELLEGAGFENRRVRWASVNALGSMGRALLANRLGAWLTNSMFCLHMDRSR